MSFGSDSRPSPIALMESQKGRFEASFLPDLRTFFEPSLRSVAATCAAGCASRSPPARASGDTHKSHDDVAAGEEVEVVDPRHPLYGRCYRLISIGKESTTRGACKESF